MGVISFARVDERLVHAQVMMTVVGSTGADAIYVVEDETANDEFMTMIIENAASRTNLFVRVLTKDEAIEEWKNDKFGDDKVLLITKTLEDMGVLVENGLDIKSIDIGGRAPQAGMITIINEVGITAEQAQYLAKIANENAVDIYFQSTPSTAKVGLKDAIKKFNISI
ncbi:PTS system mannose/fructose/N-acetylgalactosamine-transporter subunit IIB [Lacticaseibacillus paracasei]|uniref:PTS system IIB component n=1 Tax=Lacticaseibacillus paracasei NRIC 0644 TaxID=1435038 RepID=A0A0C9PUH3_LACPA|nr:PTS sugar transporter subunit IIB [Lacticaseibacillus paracasei]MXI84813.1 PTS transporter subunit IIB [Lacticaseibacillus paracasei]URW91791.1 PTS sugar transporter subunit IIB [Lacticaseibacillus paracasei]GAN35664.1 PTS system IIB component [Lacticaseibacillus paracasei NRIC 0644]GAN38185.1 PTS system IIB component [Lacticaseibacillus paracasei NRIC 1917]